MRLTSIEDVRNVIFSLSERYEVNTLSDIMLSPQMREASIKGSTFKMSHRAIHQLCTILGIPFHFAMILSERMPDIWKDVNERITRESSKLITLKIEGDEVLGIFIPKERHFTLQSFLNMVDLVFVGMSEQTGVESMIVDVNHESSTAYLYTPKDFAPFTNDFTDIFKFGVGFSVSSLEMYSPTISESILRLVCTNMTYAPAHAGMRFKSRDQDRILASIGLLIMDARRMDKYRWMLDKLQRKFLSYREAEEVHKNISKIRDSEGNELVEDAEAKIPLKSIAEYYGYDLAKIPTSVSWKSTARTPIDAFTAINHLTTVGSHYRHISEKTRMETLIYAGHLMFRQKWDLDSIAPTIDFKELH